MSNKLETKFSNKHFDAIEKGAAEKNGTYFKIIVDYFEKLLPNKKILCVDIGCGSGVHFSGLASNLNTYLIGVDAPNDYTELALERGYNEIVDINDLNTEKLNFESSSIDCIVCKDVLEHLHEPLFLIDECKRILKVKGKFLVHVPNHFSLYGRIKFLIKNNLDTFSYFGDDTRFDYPHIRFYKHDDFLKTFKKKGFSLEEDLSFMFPAIPLAGRFIFIKKIGRFLAKKYPTNFAASITMVVTKNYDIKK